MRAGPPAEASQLVLCRVRLAVTGLDALLERLAAERIEHEAIETYSNGVRHVNIPDPDGNSIAFAEPRTRWALTRPEPALRRRQFAEGPDGGA